MKPRKRSLFTTAIFGTTLLSTAAVFSQVTWNGGSDNDWTLNANWDGGSAPVFGNDVLIDVDVANQPAITSSVDLGIGEVTVGASITSGPNTSLLLGAGGSLTAASTTLAAGVGSTGSLLIGDGAAAGTLSLTSGLVGGDGDASLIFNHSDAAYEFGTDISGNLTIFHQGSGTTILSGTNTFVGDTNLLSGVLAIDSASRLGDSANQIVFDGGTLRLDGSFDLQRAMVLNAGGGSLDAGINDITLSGDISGIGSLTLDTEGTLTFSGTNKSYSGVTSLLQGTLIVQESGGLSADSALSLSSGTVVDASATATQTVAGLSGSGDLVLGSGEFSVTSTADETFFGSISGDGSLSKSGAGKLTLDGTNSYLGGTVIDGSAISISSDGNLGDAAGNLSFLNGGTLEITAGITSSREVVLDSGSILHTTSGSSTFTAEISGTGGLTKTGAGNLSLSGTNTYFGGTVIDGTDGGILSVSSDGNLGDITGSVTLSNGATLELTSGITTARNVILDSGSILSTTGGSSTFSGELSGTGGLTKTGAGGLSLTGTNLFTGDTSVIEGTLTVSSDAAFGNAAGNIQLADGTTLANSASFSTSRTLSVAGASVNLDVTAGSTLTVDGGITGSAGINKQGGGTLLLNGVGLNDYLGDTVISEGSLRAGAAGVFNSTSNVTLANGTNLNLDGYNQTIGSLSGSGSVLLGGGILTTDTNLTTGMTGVISGTGGLVKSGTGTLTLLNTTSSYSGGTTVNGGGTLVIADDSNLGNSSGELVLDGGTLKLNASPAIGTTMGRIVTLDAAGGTFDTTGRTLTLNGLISGSGSLAKNGSGTLILGNSGNSYLGGTILNAGAIQISSDGALGDSSGDVTLGGGRLIVSGSVTSDRNFIGSGALIKEGTGTLYLTAGAGNSYTGGTIVNKGTLRFDNDASLGTSTVTLSGGGLSAAGSLTGIRDLVLSADSQFEVLPTFTATWNGEISGNQILEKTGSGTLVVAGNNQHKGFIVKSGALEISNDSNIGAAGSSVTVTGGSALRFGASGTITRDIKLGTATLDTAGNNVTLSIQSAINSSYYETVTKTGAGSLTVLSSNKTGILQVDQGTLRPGASNALESHDLINLAGVSSSLELNGIDANIRALSGVSGSTVDLGSNTLTILGNSYYSYNSDYSGDISGTGSLVKTGSYTQTLSGTNSYSGGTTVNGGALIFSSSSAIPVSGLITNTAYTGAGFAMDQAFLDRFDKAASTGILGIQVDTANNLSLAGFSSSASFGTNESGVNVSGVITPQGSTYRFVGGNGQINLSSGLSGVRDLYVGTLQVNLSGNNTLSEGITAGSGGVVIFQNAASLPGSGFLTALSNGYIGTAMVADQAFLDRFDKANTNGVIGLDADTSNNLDLTGFGSGASLGTRGSVTISGVITPQDTNYRFGGVSNYSTGTMTVASDLTGARGLDVGRINLSLTGTNNYSGDTTVSNGGVVRVDNDSRLGTGKLVLNDGTYQTTASFSSSREIQIVGYGDVRTDTGVTLTQNGNITGSGHLYKYGAGTAILNGNNALNGATVYDGVLRFASANAISTNASLYTRSGGTAELAGVSRSINYLDQFGGVVDLGSANLTINSGDLYSGQIKGTGSLVKTSTGSLYIYQTNVHSGGTDLQQGTTYIRSDGAFGTGTLTLSGGTLINNSTDHLTLANNVSVSANTSIMTGSGADSGITFDGSLSGTGNITKTGDGIMSLTGTSSHSGTITVAGGILSLTGSTDSNVVVNTSTSIIMGDGSTTGLIAVSNSGLVSPGNSPGTLSVGSFEFGAGGIYDWEISSLSNYDTINAAGIVSITATQANPFIIRVLSLGDDGINPGLVSGFDMASNYSWVLASGSGITGFSESKFELDLSDFYNPADIENFSLRTSGGNLVLSYTVVPEPSNVLMVAIGAGAFLIRRRRRN